MTTKPKLPLKRTVDELILLHLLEYKNTKGQYEVPFAITQHGIAEAVKIQQKHVPRSMTKLAEKGWVFEQVMRVISTKQKRKVYFLTSKGILQSREIKYNLGEKEIRLKIGDGNLKKVKVADISSILGFKIPLLEIIHFTSPEGTFDPAHTERYSPVETAKFVEKNVTGIRKNGDIYKAALKQAWLDGTLTSDEDDILERLRKTLNISMDEHHQVELEVVRKMPIPSPEKRKIYKSALKQAWLDGKITVDEREMLEELRKVLNITPIEHRRLEVELAKDTPITSNEKCEIYKIALKQALEDGIITTDERKILEELRTVLGISEKVHRAIESRLWKKSMSR